MRLFTLSVLMVALVQVCPTRAASLAGPRSGRLADAPVIETRDGEAGARLIDPIAPDALLAIGNVSDETRSLVFRVRSAGAAAIRLRFEDFRLPAGTQLYIYAAAEGADPAIVLGPYTLAGPLDTGEFTTPAVRGAEAVVELQVAGDLPADLPFRIASVEHKDPAEAAAMTDEEFRDGEPRSRDGEFRSGTFRGMPVQYRIEDGMAILDSDTILGTEAEMEQSSTQVRKDRERYSIGITSTRYRWPGGVIPYAIDPNIPSNYRINDAVNHWNTNMAGVIRWVPRTTQANYVYFRYTSNASTCQSYIGMIGYGQSLYVGNYCSTGNMIHEMGHAVGLFHEHNRLDRDSKVTISWGNVQAGQSSNFYINTNGYNIDLYDYGSIMHYPANAFTSNGQPTITTIPAGIPIGQRSGLSAGDIAGVRNLYGGTVVTPAPVTTVSSTPSDATVNVDGSSVTGSGNFSWTPGTLHTVAGPTIQGTATTRYLFAKWSDGGAATHTVTADSVPSALTAFYSRQFSLTAAASPAGAGSVAVSPSSADGFYPEGASVTLNASAGAGYCFTGWTGLVTGAPAATSLVVNKSYSVLANFVAGAAAVSPASVTVPHAGGSGNISVSANKGCSWTAKSATAWITVSVKQTGNGSGTVTYSVAPNGGAARTGTIQIGATAVTVTQQ